MMCFFLLKFVDVDGSFLGGLVIPAKSQIDAIGRAWDLRLNPGGALESARLIHPISNQNIPHDRFGRLLDQKEIETFA